MTKLRLKQKHLQFGLTFCLSVAVFAHSPSATAHGLKPHSLFTEVAYAYLNAMKVCVPAQRPGEGELVDLAACTVQCKQQFIDPARELEWTSTCYENLCDRVWVDNEEQCDPDTGSCTPVPPYYKQIPGVKCQGLTGSAKYSCVNHCVQKDTAANNPECTGDEIDYTPEMDIVVPSGGGPATYVLEGHPAWLPTEPARREEIAEEFCRSSCYSLKYSFPRPGCEALGSVLSYGDLETEKAANAVKFLRESVDPLCPNPSEIPFRYPATAMKAACEEDASVKRLYGRPKGVRTYGSSFDPNDPTNLIFTRATDGTLKNVPVLLAQSMVPDIPDRSNPDVTVPDIAGMVLGVNTAFADRLDDTKGRYRFIPAYEQAVKLLAEYVTGAVGAIGGVIAFYFYALGCLTSYLWGDGNDCFENWYDNLKDYYNWWEDKIQHIENYSLLSFDSQPDVNGWDLTSLYHFIGENGFNHCDDDDNCGVNITSGTEWYGLVAGHTVERIISPLIDFRIAYEDSTKTIENYQIGAGDRPVHDGMPKTNTEHGRWYYEWRSILEVDFRPVDNMAYYWWHKWHYARGQALAANGRQLYGLFPLGIVVHSIQDMTLYHHANAQLLPHHPDLENWIGNGLQLDADAPGRLNPDDSDKFALNGPWEWDFYRSVASYIHQIAQLKSNGLLHPRVLAHFVRQKLLDGNVCSEEEQDDRTEPLSFYDYGCSKEGVRHVVIPLAVAASIMLIVEGTQPVASPSEAAYIGLSTPLSKFEAVPTTNPLATSCSAAPSVQTFSSIDGPGMTSGGPVPEDPDDSLDFVFATTQQVVKDATASFYRNQLNVGALLSVLLKEQARGRALRAGRSLDEATLGKLAKAEIDKLKGFGQFFANGSLPMFAQANACAMLPVASVHKFSPSKIADLQATCGGTKDSDGDGVPDLHDECMTGSSLLSGCGTVGPNGCIFQGGTPMVFKTGAPNVSSMVVPNPAYTPDAGTGP